MEEFNLTSDTDFTAIKAIIMGKVNGQYQNEVHYFYLFNGGGGGVPVRVVCIKDIFNISLWFMFSFRYIYRFTLRAT